jgi:hypothetical protein
MAPSLEQPAEPQFSVALRGYARAAVHERIDQLTADREDLARRAVELAEEIATLQQAMDRRRYAPTYVALMQRLEEVLGSAYDDADRMRQDSVRCANADRERAERVVAGQLRRVAELTSLAAEATRAQCTELTEAADRDAAQIRAAATRALNAVSAAADTLVRVTEEEVHAHTTEVLGALLMQRRASDVAERESLPAPGRRRPGLAPTAAPTAAH